MVTNLLNKKIKSQFVLVFIANLVLIFLSACQQQQKKIVEEKQAQSISNEIWGIKLGCDTTKVIEMMSKEYPSATHSWLENSDSTYVLEFYNDYDGFIFAGVEWRNADFFLENGKLYKVKFSKHGTIREWEYTEGIRAGLEEYDSISTKLRKKYSSFFGGETNDGNGNYISTFEDKNTRIILDGYVFPRIFIRNKDDFGSKWLRIEYIDKNNPVIIQEDEQEKRELEREKREKKRLEQEMQRKEQLKESRKENAYGDL